MKTINLFFVTITLFIFFQSKAQVSASDAGTTPGALSVSLTGSANYSVPLDLPPGIKDIAPSLAITYSSQGGNGIAGWGWNITGLSTITRIASTTYHDGDIDPVDFDSTDRFALNGQRLLLKSGTYGQNGAVYQTENYSNIKVVSYGTSPYGSSYGPSYFIVYYPDGSRAWYGNAGNSRGRLEWALYKWQDPQSNFILYEYSQSNNLLRISKISYGSRGSTAAPISINFLYKTRSRAESSYVGGIFFRQVHILDRIEAKYSSVLLRKYQLGHSTNSLGYQTVKFIQEYNGDNKALSPINFTYDSSSDGIVKSSDTNTFSRSLSSSDKKTSGDFNGDGRLDIVAYGNATSGSSSYVNVFMNLHEGSGMYKKEFSLSKFDELVTGPILINNKLSDKQGITTITETSSTSTSTSTVSFRTSIVGSTSLEHQYTKSWSAPTYRSDSYSCSGKYYYKIPKKYVSGDFNGDGLLDVIAVTMRYNERICNKVTCDDGGGGGGGDPQPIAKAQQTTMAKAPGDGSTFCCECTNYTRSTAKSYFIDLNSQKTTNFANYSGQLSLEMGYSDQAFAADFNGDGKSDLIIVKTGKAYVYSLDNNNILRYVTEISDTNIKLDKPVIPGDFNGDGKFDFAIATSIGSSNWRFFLSKGNAFYNYTKDIGIVYDNTRASGDYTYEYFYNPQDFNGDGKTDILKHFVQVKAVVRRGYPTSYETYQHLELFSNVATSSTTPAFSRKLSKTYSNANVRRYGLPIFTEGRFDNGNYEYAFFSGTYMQLYEFTRDNRLDTSLKQIVNYGIKSTIKYDNLVVVPNNRSNGDVYGPSSNQVYPYININLAPNFKVVENIEETGSGITRKKDFYYAGAVAHVNGLGFLGFGSILRSNWYGTNVSQLWNGTRYDPLKRGAVVKEWVSNVKLGRTDTEASTVDYTYNFTVNSNKVYVSVPTKAISKDLLQGTTNTKTFVYDAYFNPTSVVTSTAAGSKTETYTYSHNPSAVNEYYHIGRSKKKTVRSTLNGHSFTTEEEYVYSNNLMTSLKRRGSGTPWLTESFQYDAWGNVIRKGISASGMPTRYEYFTFNSQGRFLISQKDTEGLTTQFLLDKTYGNIFQVTDPYGIITKYEYDGWNRITKETDYLNISSTYSYSNASNGSFETSINYNQGPDEFITINAFGWETRSRTMTLNGQYVYIDKKYDPAGRLVQISEPSFSSPSQWNTTVFDEYGRILEQRSYTGKVTNFSYNGLIVTASDGNRTATTTKDASGNIIKLVDNGGTINYKYFGNGTLKEVDYGGQKIMVEIDAWGRRTKMVDPSAGTYTYQYNLYGELLKETSPKGESNYTYDSTGKITKKTIIGDETDLELNYTYNSDKLLASIAGLDKKFGKYYNYNYTYDSYRRNTKIVEENDLARFEKQLTYDTYGRPLRTSYLATNKSDGTSSTARINNHYDTHSGLLEEIKDSGNTTSLWKLNTHDQRGQATKVTLGNGFVETNSFDTYGLPKNARAYKSGTSTTYAMSMDYTFNAQRGILTYRKNNNLGWTENFGHDSLNRLTTISGSTSRNQTYNSNGTIKTNSVVGNYLYNSSKKYQLASIDLNALGQSFFNDKEQQHITYNAFKKPVDVYQEGNGKVSFEYGVMGNRSHAWYGGLDNKKEERRYHKHYSAIMPVEIIEDKATNNVKIISYFGGDGYTAPIAFLKTKNNSLSGFHYLHRDYLGSILAITNASGSVVEQRQFGAWGTVDRFKKGSSYTSFDHTSILGRGYTGHEHFFEIGLIHMNGRMYDAQLGRFLSPDNYVQDPYNTQNFNRYGYVMNNPLVYADPSGEIIPLLIIGAFAVGAYLGGAQANNSYNPFKWNWRSSATWVGVVGGGIIGAATAGVGTAVAGALTASFSVAAGSVLGQVAIGAISGYVAGFLGGGYMELLPGGSGDFWKGAKRGGISGAILGGALAGAAAWIQGKPFVPGGGGNPRPIQGKIPTESKPITSLDNELVIDADLMPSPRPQTPVSSTGNNTNASLPKINDGTGLVELNIKATKLPEFKVDGISRGIVPSYPANPAVPGTIQRTTLYPGEIIDRFGGNGRWFSTPGTSYGARSIPPGKGPYNQFKVLKPFEVIKSLSNPGPMNGQTGFGTQYYSNIELKILLERGILEQL